MFASVTKKIYEKIKGIKNPTEQKNAYIYFESQVLTNPIIKHQFEVLNFIKNNRNKIKTEVSFTNFKEKLKTKNSKFLEENKISHLGVWKTTNSLLEYFNINPKELVLTELDSAIDLYSSSKNLNETALKNIVFKKDAFLLSEEDKKREFKEQGNLIKESFQNIIKTKNKASLKENFKIINFISKFLKQDKQIMIFESLKSLSSDEFVSSTKKLYKLRILSEKLFIEEGRFDDEEEDEKPEKETAQQKRSGDKVEKEIEAHYSQSKSERKDTKLQNLTYLKNIIISTSIGELEDSVKLHFEVPIYPIGRRTNGTRTSALMVKNKLENLRRIFINTCIYQKSRDNVFDPHGLVWEIILRVQLKVGQSAIAKINCYLNCNEKNKGKNTKDTYVETGYAMLKDFDAFLPELMGDLSVNLTPEGQEQKVKANINTALLQKYTMGKNRNPGNLAVDNFKTDVGTIY